MPQRATRRRAARACSAAIRCAKLEKFSETSSTPSSRAWRAPRRRASPRSRSARRRAGASRRASSRGGSARSAGTRASRPPGCGRPRRRRRRPRARPRAGRPPRRSRRAACACAATPTRPPRAPPWRARRARRPRASSTVQPWRSTRPTALRTVFARLPASENSRGSTTASSPTWRVRSPSASYADRFAGTAPSSTTSQPRDGALEERGHHRRGAAGRADRVAGDDRRLPQRPVGEHPAGGEVERLVGAQREQRDRVVAVRRDQRGGAAVTLLVVAVAHALGREQESQQQDERARGDGEHDVEADRRGVAHATRRDQLDRRGRGAQRDVAEAGRVARRDQHAERGREGGGQRHERDQCGDQRGGRALVVTARAHRPAEPERDREPEQRLLVVEALRQVHDREHREHRDRGAPGRPPAVEHAEREPQRADPAGERDRVRDGLRGLRLELDQQALARRRVGRERGDDRHHAGERGGGRGEPAGLTRCRHRR